MANVAVTNTFSAGTVIVSSQVNTNFSDLVNYINNRNGGGTAWDVLSVAGTSTLTGNVTFSAVMLGAAGSLAAPAYSFTGDSNTGMYNISADRISFVANGISRLEVYAYVQAMTSGFLTVDGLVGTPSISFSGDTDTGFYRTTSNQIRAAAGGVALFAADSGSFDVSGSAQFRTADGAVGAPAYSFSNDIDTGFYSSAANAMRFVTGGVGAMTLDSDVTASNTRMTIYDVTAAAQVRVSRGAADSGGAGFRVLRVPN